MKYVIVLTALLLFLPQHGFANPILGFANDVLIKTSKNHHEYFEEMKRRHGKSPSQSSLLLSKAEFINFLIHVQGLASGPQSKNESFFWRRDKPKIPLVNRANATVDYKTGFNKPQMPPMRWTADGRIGVATDTGGIDGVPEPLRFRINVPEKLTNTFIDSEPGPITMGVQNTANVGQGRPFDVTTYSKTVGYDEWGFFKLENGKTVELAKVAESVTICDPFEKAPGARENPYRCGLNDNDDCYDLTLVAGGVEVGYDTSTVVEEYEGDIDALFLSQNNKWDRLFSRPFTVRVSNPKTKNAKIESIEFQSHSTIKHSPVRNGVMFEIMTPADGRLMIARRSFLPLVWKHSVSGEVKVGNYEWYTVLLILMPRHAMRPSGATYTPYPMPLTIHV